MFVTVAHCQALYKPTMADSQKTGVSLDSLNLGRKLYVNYCGSCHTLFLPSKFTKTKWSEVMPKMQKKAKCNDREAVLITNFLIARSKQE